MQKIKTLNIIMTVELLFSLGTLVASFFSRYWIYKLLAMVLFCVCIYFTYIIGCLLEMITKQELKFQDEIDKIKKQIMHQGTYDLSRATTNAPDMVS